MTRTQRVLWVLRRWDIFTAICAWPELRSIRGNTLNEKSCHSLFGWSFACLKNWSQIYAMNSGRGHSPIKLLSQASQIYRSILTKELKHHNFLSWFKFRAACLLDCSASEENKLDIGIYLSNPELLNNFFVINLVRMCRCPIVDLDPPLESFVFQIDLENLEPHLEKLATKDIVLGMTFHSFTSRPFRSTTKSILLLWVCYNIQTKISCFRPFKDRSSVDLINIHELLTSELPLLDAVTQVIIIIVPASRSAHNREIKARAESCGL